jgi:uncharacterized protein YheU (UPF0270 family)
MLAVMPDEFSPSPRPTEEQGIDVPYQKITADALEQLIESFILREGTDYGSVEATLSRKMEDIRRGLKNQDLKVVFDLTSESCSIVKN